VTVERRLRECLVRIREALVDGDTDYAMHLVSVALDHDGQPGVACPSCGLRFRWAGERDHHLRFVHWQEAA
jgi:hypothetical protein